MARRNPTGEGGPETAASNVAGRGQGAGEPLETAGVPTQSVESYLGRLIRLGEAVAVVVAALKHKAPWRGATEHLVMSPLEFMQRPAALVPRARQYLIRFHGVLVWRAVQSCTHQPACASAALARVTLARMAEALAAQMKGLGLALC